MKVSVSRLKRFKACRKSFWFRYVEGLVPIEKAEALELGSSYHERLEMLERGEEMPEGEYTKDAAMAEAWRKYVLPQLKVTASEEWFEKQIGAHTLVGRVDGVADDGCIVEHKTTSSDITEGGEYEYNLLWDEQLLAYFSLTGARKAYYTVCRKPTIRLKKGETEEEFFERMVAWYDEDTEQKVRVFIVERTDEEVAEFEKDFERICDEIESCSNYYRNTCHCNAWGRRCEYSSVCLNYNPDATYVEFEREERKNED